MKIKLLKILLVLDLLIGELFSVITLKEAYYDELCCFVLKPQSKIYSLEQITESKYFLNKIEFNQDKGKIHLL